MRPRIRTVPIAYKISLRGGEIADEEGEAIALPPPLDEFRCCVRYDEWCVSWVIDHYDSGMSISGPVANIGSSDQAIAYARKWLRDGTSKRGAIAWLCRYLRHLLKHRPEYVARLREFK